MNQIQIHNVESVTTDTDHFKKDDCCREFWVLNITSRDKDGVQIALRLYSQKPLLIENA